jgi:hypothetical protein
MLSKDQFYKKIMGIKIATSITGKASYSILEYIPGKNKLKFKRNNTGKEWQLNVDELFNAYRQESYFNTIILKKYITGRVFSPAFAVLLKIKACDRKGYRI